MLCAAFPEQPSGTAVTITRELAAPSPSTPLASRGVTDGSTYQLSSLFALTPLTARLLDIDSSNPQPLLPSPRWELKAVT